MRVSEFIRQKAATDTPNEKQTEPRRRLGEEEEDCRKEESHLEYF